MVHHESRPRPISLDDSGLPPELTSSGTSAAPRPGQTAASTGPATVAPTESPATVPPDAATPTGTESPPRADPEALAPDQPDVPEPASPAPTARRRRLPAPRSRVGGIWAAAVLFAAVLLLLLIFVLENGQRTEISFFGQHGHLPQGVALLLAAVCGILLVAIPGTARIIQLRIRDRRHRGAAAPANPPDSAGDFRR